jgi:alkylation response protein AidB-like acyl-CoA dehydrogenase
VPEYHAPLEDIGFLLEQVLDVGQLAKMPGYADATPDVIGSVIEEGARFCEQVLAPLNQTGDAQGCTYERGQVRTPDGFREAYAQYCAGGWPAMTASPEHGGQGLPHLTRFVLDEMLCSSNLSFSMYPELSHGATSLLEHWASDDLKERFLGRVVDGSWGGTMCLTEPQAGTDLGLIRTHAVPAGDGSYRVTGTKIFISAGEHDLTENIVHLVLAKLPDAPAGTRGISVFLVPKLVPGAAGALEPNGVSCGSIEHKMGIKGNATCVMNFENARGWLVGEENKGMRAMFTMMNGARLGVGMQGLGLAEVSYQNALRYAKDRLQGRAPGGPRDPQLEADPIVVHPDVRRMLMTMKAYTEGMRALAYWVCMLLDAEEKHADAAEREIAADLVALMTPVVKGFLTDVGFECTNLALQCYGGHGYIREYGMEQFVRDARIAQIYEGTNGVQAMDLLGRKVPEANGRLVKRFAALVQKDLEAAAQSDNSRVKAIGAALIPATAALQRATMGILERAQKDASEIGAASSEYLRLFGVVSTGWMWLRMAVAAASHPEHPLASDKLATAEFYMAKLLPQTRTLEAQIAAGAGPLMGISF